MASQIFRGNRVAQSLSGDLAVNNQRDSTNSSASDYGLALHCKNRRLKQPPGKPGDSLPMSRSHNEEDGLKRLKDVGDKQTLITAAELGLIEQYRKLKLEGQEVLQVDFPYHYSSILYACYGNQYKILQLVEREFCSGLEELLRMHTTRCWIGKNSAMVAAYQGHLETMLYIIDLDLQGKFQNVDLFKQRDILGKTAMDWAASQGHSDTIEVLLVRSLFKLLPPDCTEPLVVRTRWKLVSLLARLAGHCRDYDPASNRGFFQEVLAAINYNPATATAAAVVAPEPPAKSAAGGDGAGGRGSSRNVSQRSLKTAAGIYDNSWAELPDQQQQGTGCAAVRQPRGGVIGAVGREPGSGVGGISKKWAAAGSTDDGVGALTRLPSAFVLDSPSGSGSKEVHITREMLLDVVTSAVQGGMNCMGVIMYIQSLLQQARYFDDLVAACTSWEVQLLDTCRNKSEVQSVLTPTDLDPSEPVGFALATFDKAFLSHKYIQQIFTEKWDTMGITDYFRSVLGVVWLLLMLVLSYSGWAVVCPVAIILRSFFSPVEDFLQRGKVIVDSRFPWHVPLYRWLLAQCSLIVFVVLLSYRVFSDSIDANVSSSVSPVNTLLALWCLAILVDEAQEFFEEGRTAYMASGWNLLDVTMSTAFLLQYLIRIGIVAVQDARNINVLLGVNDLLAAAALMAWFRTCLVRCRRVPLLFQTLRSRVMLWWMQMLLQDVTRFALLVIVILLGFTVGMEALFKDVCVEMGVSGDCVKYSSWAYNWQKHGLLGGMAFLQYVALGSMPVTDFEQKRVTGLIFYLVFAVITSILMLNLFIAMLADTYARVSNKAQVEFRYRKAVIMASFSRREAISPPFNLLHLVFAAIGNLLRRLVFGRGGFTAVRLKKNEETPLFSWYFPQGEELSAVLDLQQRVVGDFLRAVRVALAKDQLQADLPMLMRQLMDHQRDDEGEGQQGLKRLRGKETCLGVEVVQQAATVRVVPGGSSGAGDGVVAGTAQYGSTNTREARPPPASREAFSAASYYRRGDQLEGTRVHTMTGRGVGYCREIRHGVLNVDVWPDSGYFAAGAVATPSMPPPPPPGAPPPNNNNTGGGDSFTRALIAAAFVTGVGIGVYFDSNITLSPTNVASTEIVDRRTPNSELCMAYGYSAMAFDQRLFVSFNPSSSTAVLFLLLSWHFFCGMHIHNTAASCAAVHRVSSFDTLTFNVYVSQPEVKPGCILRRSNVNVLEGKKLVSSQQVDSCKRSMNTFAFVGDLDNSPEVSCVYHSEEAENQYLLNPKRLVPAGSDTTAGPAGQQQQQQQGLGLGLGTAALGAGGAPQGGL
ncbi:hypothetical protein VOLCADRAFT_107632 [Volvox carteri f. nagariensis]|uniref:Ion transport domain-containing protein n=1 Tax=Volvox carteri f. nagariensis TaxID=3068 RepID=D8UFB3_VOLCA|nr:uncharacterized protein VOLCADRAFT_107632 [Volvox carteri f. nagariensis]EFJ41546.1 hypothetical protein VOLCADRAFT_107632 [Volvox carteri f. nagariensis]|eukprot:XP_002957337.1 hypothetical protein VOLCADRAFT_107632 [Volvox carteri f. nagariensis]